MKTLKIRLLVPICLVAAGLLFYLTGCGGDDGGGGGRTGVVNDGVLSRTDTYELRGLDPSGGSHMATSGDYTVIGTLTFSPSGTTAGTSYKVSAGPVAVHAGE